jgi:hypothetical protein
VGILEPDLDLDRGVHVPPFPGDVVDVDDAAEVEALSQVGKLGTVNDEEGTFEAKRAMDPDPAPAVGLAVEGDGAGEPFLVEPVGLVEGVGDMAEVAFNLGHAIVIGGETADHDGLRGCVP